MPFVEQEEHYEDQILDGKKVKVYKPRVEVTIKHLKQVENIYQMQRLKKT